MTSAPPDDAAPEPAPDAAEEAARAAPCAAPGKRLTPAAQRALHEAAVRRAATSHDAPPEAGGPAGLEPTRYGDWERKGLAVDF